jgi:hypothetical protein
MSFGGTTMEDDKIEIEEGEHRAELVCQDDIAKIAKLTKEELKKYAHSRLGKELDLTRRISLLRIDVITLVKNKLNLPNAEAKSDSTETPTEKVADRTVEYVFEPVRRRVFEVTAELLKRTDLIHCWLIDEDGKEL